MHIAWYATSNNEPSNDAEVATNFDQRPVVGISLKRYLVTRNGEPDRHDTPIDIPDSLRLPRFMVQDDAKFDEDPSGLSREYKLVLQSVVCHRGKSLHSGHYISFARVAPKLLKDNRQHDHDPPPDYEEPQWVKFDDLEVDGRVTMVEDIGEALRQEMPYLLFYQIVPMVDVCDISSNGSIDEPPTYVESALHSPASRGRVDSSSEQGGELSRAASGYFESSTTLVQNDASIRSSADNDRPAFSLNLADTRLQHGPQLKVPDSRRGSAAFSETQTVATPDTLPSPILTPAITPQEEITGGRLSRAVAVFSKTNSKSRPASQASEGRVSLSIFGLRPNKQDVLNSKTSTTTEDLDEQAVTEDEDQAKNSDQAKPGKDKERGRMPRLHHHKKDRSKSKSQSRNKPLKRKNKADGKEGVPDRECIVM